MRILHTARIQGSTTTRIYYYLNPRGIGEERRAAISKLPWDWSALTGIYSSVVLHEARQKYWEVEYKK